MQFEPRNILVIDFGQLGDVVLSLPALGAIRRRFPKSRITIAVGRAAGAVLELASLADEVLPVDRVALRDGPAVLSVFRIGQFVRDVRRRKFDFVIDLHSLSETNLLGYLSGARERLYARRPNRSLDYLSNFRPHPPVEDRAKHAIDRYLDVLAPLNVGEVSRIPRLPVRDEDKVSVAGMFKKAKAGSDAPLVGMFPGAGHPSRRWLLERFGELAHRLARNDGVRTVIFAGPEERELVRGARSEFPASAIVFDKLTIPQLAAATQCLSVFVSNDTGPMHIAAATGTPVVILMAHHPMFSCYIPPGERHRVVHARTIADVTIEEVYEVTRASFTAQRAASLFAD